jgi:hypothetical protein
MRGTKMVLAVVGLMIAMFVVLAAPAMANDNDRNNHHNRFDFDDDDDIRFVFFDDDDDFDFDFDDDLDQDADSDDVDQSFVVTNTGDNSNQCANVQGVANTGNAQSQIDVSQFGDGFGDFDRGHHDRFFRDFDFDGFNDDFEIEDSGASVVVSPTNTTRCDQQVNQAAAAYGGGGPYYYYW